MPFVRIAIVAGKADIDMPAGVAGVIRVGKTYWEGPKTVTRTPTALADQLIEGGVQNGRVRRFPERFLSIARQPDHRSGPCRRVVGIERDIAPHDRAPLFGKFPWEGPVNPNKSISNKLLQLCVAERAHRFICIRRHEILITPGQPQSPSRGKVGEAHLVVKARRRQSAAGAPASARSKRAMPLAAQEEDRSDIADHHHGSQSLARSLQAINAPFGQANLAAHRAPGVRAAMRAESRQPGWAGLRIERVECAPRRMAR
jgi:hypothetical protein